MLRVIVPLYCCCFWVLGSSAEVITAFVILPQNDSYLISIEKTKAVFHLASSAAESILPSYQFKFVFRDDKCEPDLAMQRAVTANQCHQGEQNRANVIFGPMCEFCVAQVARVIKFWSIPMISTGGLTFDFSKPKTEPETEFFLLVRLGMLDFLKMSLALVSIFERYGWHRVLLVYEKDGCMWLAGKWTCKLMMETLVELFKTKEIVFDAIDISRHRDIPLYEILNRENLNYSSKPYW
ncbi:atrial natriuretic peptide receptor 3 [Cimex lectularius]|uniref:Receptor ligand binding region domain-containing protein n=1 Tax=Cimex lectularius TaxID=79782 RepID=A0A8I6SUQ5_CIMLE|nr:atrial natriuretic peptide receptor 3 [Cimex lectularius]